MIRIYVGILLLGSFFRAASQEDKIVNKDSCIVLMDVITYKLADSLNFYVEKKALPEFIKNIKGCHNNYEYPSEYQDAGFVIQIPLYLSHVYYTFGNNNFCINFYDTTSEDQHTMRAVSVYYDFDSSYKNFVLKEVSEGKRQEIRDSVSGRKIYYFLNFNSRHAASIFLENNIILFYYTKEKQFEEELKRSILSFKLKERE